MYSISDLDPTPRRLAAMSVSPELTAEQKSKISPQYLSDNPSEDTRGLDLHCSQVDTDWEKRVKFEKRVRWVRFMLWTGVSALTPSLHVMLTSWH